MKLIEFEHIDTGFPYTLTEDKFAWSRVYEYPLILNLIEKYKTNNSPLIHNTSWGFEGVHIWFKTQLETKFSAKNVTNSDILSSQLENTCVFDITKTPQQNWIEAFDFVVNVSTLEEVNANHLEVFNNLFSMVKPGGYFLCTFDLPGLQLEAFESIFNQKFLRSDKAINGENSVLPNLVCKNLNCGYMVVQKN